MMAVHPGKRSFAWSFRSLLTDGIALASLMADQAVFALTNFITNIFFARWLTAVDYGMFAVSFSGFLLLSVIHYGAILEPVLVQSARVAFDRRRSYIVTLVIAHLIWIGSIIALAAAAYVVARMLQAPDIGLMIVGASIGGSFLSTLLTARRLCLVFLSSRVSAVIGIIYMAGVIITTALIRQYAHVNWFDLWLVMGGWSLLCSTVIFILLYCSLGGTNRYSLLELGQFQWHYARYGLVAALCSWGRVDGLLLILAHAAGLEIVAETRAVMNISNPLMQIILALQTSWLVSFSRDHSPARLWKTSAVYWAGAILAILAIAASYNQIIAWVYSGRYLTGAWMLPLYCIAHTLNGGESIFTTFMKGVGSLRRGYAPQIVGCAVSIGLGLLLIPWMGQIGFMYAAIASFGAGGILAFVLLQYR
jgi:O-antigen/teichoic acid export membrane protein